jgi:hypothetical protein
MRHPPAFEPFPNHLIDDMHKAFDVVCSTWMSPDFRRKAFKRPYDWMASLLAMTIAMSGVACAVLCIALINAFRRGESNGPARKGGPGLAAEPLAGDRDPGYASALV